MITRARELAWCCVDVILHTDYKKFMFSVRDWSYIQLHHAKSSEEKDWSQKFAWFTQSKECQKITTIHGEKDSLTVHS